jgi:hypothetical protein
MPGSKEDVGWVLIFLGLVLLPLLPMVVKFRWLEPRNGSRWARWLLWALVIPGEIVALTFIYLGVRPLLIGTPLIGPIDELVRVVVDHIIVAVIVIIFLILSILALALRIRQPLYPFHIHMNASVPPELTYEHWRDRQQKPPRR